MYKKNEMNSETFGEIIQQARNKQGISSKKVAQLSAKHYLIVHSFVLKY